MVESQKSAILSHHHSQFCHSSCQKICHHNPPWCHRHGQYLTTLMGLKHCYPIDMRKERARSFSNDHANGLNFEPPL
jgi:hypothetical protein